MNDSTLTQLKILVERAVRPVRASTPCKRKMREELLAHVLAVFEEEMTKLGDERTALERTGQRFGNAAELTGQLQASVPTSDALAGFMDRLWFLPGESALRRAVRRTLLLIGAFLPMFLLAVWLALRARGSDWPAEAWSLLARVLFSVTFLVFGFTYLTEGMRRALHGPDGRSRPRSVLIAVVGSLLIPVVVCVLDTGARGWGLMDVLLILYFACASLGIVVALASENAARLRYHQEWASLPIE
jgi:hypothetical protein